MSIPCYLGGALWWCSLVVVLSGGGLWWCSLAGFSGGALKD